jgi:hypothetical protein
MSLLIYHPSLNESALVLTVAYPKMTARSLSNAMMVHRSDPLLRTQYTVFQARVDVLASTVNPSAGFLY